MAQRFRRQIDIHRARQRIGDHQRRRGQIICLHQRIDAPLEIAIAAEHGGHHQIFFRHRLAHRVGQRSAVADAGGAAESHQVEVELFE